uniref:Ig-like domain-containing protein n=1 Tax=Ideonella sp. TaxID=1929293 RepID=UPI0037C0B69C
AHTIAIVNVSAAGAQSAASAALTIDIDAVKETPALIDLAATSDSGGSNTDNITNVTRPVFSVGPLPKAGDVFNLYVNGSKVAATYDAATGSLTPVTALAAATHSITYSLTNAAGVESARSPALSLVIDTTTPTTNLNSFASRLTTATDLGLSNSDGITSNNKPSLSNQALTTAQFGEAGAVGTADLFVNGVKVASVWDKVAGTLTPVNALPDGAHTLSFTRTDSAGNETTVSTQSYRITVDTSTPVAPTLTPDMLATADSGSSNSDNITSNTRPGFVVGDPLPGGRIDLLVDGVVVAATYTASTKTLTPNVALSEGAHTIAIVNVSAAGAQSAASAALTIDIDAVKETPATAPDLADASDSGSSTTDNITNLTRPGFVVGNLPKAGDVANLYVNGVKVAATYDALSGTLTPNSALTAATHTITWSVTNAAGVESARSAGLSITIDTTAPTTPVALDLQAASDTGASNTDNITANNLPSFTVGTVAATDSVSLWVDGAQVPSTFDFASRTITATQALSDGVHQVSIKVTDAAGNVSLASVSLKVDIRTQAPLPLTAPDLLASSDTAGNDSDDLTSVNQPVFKVPAAPANCTAVLYVDGIKINATYNAQALTLKPVGVLSEGNHLITYAWVDSATGAESQLSPPLPMRIAFSPVVAGSEGNDALVAAVDSDETIVNRNLGGGVTIDTVQTPTFDQAFIALGGNDLVQAGDGGDWVDLGASGNSVHSGTGQAVTTANVAQTVLMSEEDWKMVDSFGNFATGITANSASDAKSINGWANVANGGWGQDVVKGGAGVDLVYGSFDNDYIDGGAGIDGLRGGNGDDTLVGGAGNDVLRGDDGSDTFYWRGSDKGNTGAPERDQILDFSSLNFAEGGDVLDLRDLLVGEAFGPNGTVGNLANYLEFDTSSNPGTTLIHVSSKGQFTNGAYSAAAEDLTISLNGVDLRSALDLTAQATDAQLIEELLKRGNLIAGG